MTGLHDKRVTRESRRSSLKRPITAAAPPPARRTKHAEVPAPPRKRERSAPAARAAARSLRLPDGERDSEDAAPAPPPPPKRPRSAPSYGDRDPTDAAVAPPRTAPRAAEAPVPPPPKRKGGSARAAWSSAAYVLRSRQVDRKPCHSPARYREELKHDGPCSSKNKPKQPEPWEAISCARMGLEHYNSMNQGDEHELVRAVGVHSFIWSGVWLHANFVATSKGANSSVDIVPKMFFAELKIDGFGLSCASCVKIDSGESNNLGGCEHCQGKIMHPAYGVYLGGKDRCHSAAAGVYLCEEEDRQHADDADDLEIEFDF